MGGCHGPVYGISDPYQTKSADPKACVGELTFVATDNTTTTLPQQSNTIFQLFRSFSASLDRFLCQFKTHLSWSSAAVRWAPLQLCTCRLDGKRPSMASARVGTSTDDAQNQTSAFFSHTGPPIFWHTGPQYSVASARLVHHQLSWESASCCVGVHGRHLSPRCTPSSEVQDVPISPFTPPV